MNNNKEVNCEDRAEEVMPNFSFWGDGVVLVKTEQWYKSRDKIIALLNQEPLTCGNCQMSFPSFLKTDFVAHVEHCGKQSQEPDYSKWKGWEHGMEGLDSANGPIKLASESQAPDHTPEKVEQFTSLLLFILFLLWQLNWL